MLNGYSAALLAALRRVLAGWDCDLDGDHVTFSQPGGPFRPARHAPSWQELSGAIQDTCAEHGITRARVLPLHGLQDAELTFSAVQALDPYLKHRQRYTYSSGFFPQPVVRFTGRRDRHGMLRSGFATSFVNTSIVQPVASIDEHAALIDTWIGVLSRLGIHSSHVSITGSLNVWRRPPVCGITLRFGHGSLISGDAVLLWNADDPSFLATDLGSGLERLRWVITQRSWPQVVFGDFAGQASFGVLDAVRTATLVIGSGIGPAPNGPGNAIRRLLRTAIAHQSGLGMSRVVRLSHQYWTLFGPLSAPWPEVCRIVDAEVSGTAG